MGVPAVHEFGCLEDRPYYTREFVEGLSFERWLSSETDPSTGVQILHRLAKTVAQVHRQGILHRRIRPESVLITAQNRPVLIGFAMACAFGVESPMEIDVKALKDTLRWFSERLGDRAPPSVGSLAQSSSATTAAALAEALAACLPENQTCPVKASFPRETPRAKPWWRFW